MMRVTITRDYLADSDSNEKGMVWEWSENPLISESVKGDTAPDFKVTGYAYDDDDECYYSFRLETVGEPSDENLSTVFNMFATHAGAVRLTFPRRPDLDVS